MRHAPPTFAEIADGMLVFTIGPVFGLTMCPGALLCAPALIAVLVPLLAVVVAAALLAAVMAAPLVLVGLLRRALTA
jgi:hypothetical protein